jgi:hypothetical protein
MYALSVTPVTTVFSVIEEAFREEAAMHGFTLDKGE